MAGFRFAGQVRVKDVFRLGNDDVRGAAMGGEDVGQVPKVKVYTSLLYSACG